MCWFTFFLIVCFCQGPGTAQIGEGGDNSWIVLDEEDGEMEESEEVEITGEERNSESPTPESQQKNGSKGEEGKTLNFMLYILIFLILSHRPELILKSLPIKTYTPQ